MLTVENDEREEESLEVDEEVTAEKEEELLAEPHPSAEDNGVPVINYHEEVVEQVDIYQDETLSFPELALPGKKDLSDDQIALNEEIRAIERIYNFEELCEIAYQETKKIEVQPTTANYYRTIVEPDSPAMDWEESEDTSPPATEPTVSAISSLEMTVPAPCVSSTAVPSLVIPPSVPLTPSAVTALEHAPIIIPVSPATTTSEHATTIPPQAFNRIY